jgi:hypothetical protein
LLCGYHEIDLHAATAPRTVGLDPVIRLLPASQSSVGHVDGRIKSTPVRLSEVGCKVRELPPPPIVITGLDPVIHALIGIDPGSGKRVDGRIKSSHDDYGWFEPLVEPARIARSLNRAAVDQVWP